MIIDRFCVDVPVLRGAGVCNGQDACITFQAVERALDADLFYIIEIVGPANDDAVVPDIPDIEPGERILRRCAEKGKNANADDQGPIPHTE
jgi:hypothetical protein